MKKLFRVLLAGITLIIAGNAMADIGIVANNVYDPSGLSNITLKSRYTSYTLVIKSDTQMQPKFSALDSMVDFYGTDNTGNQVLLGTATVTQGRYGYIISNFTPKYQDGNPITTAYGEIDGNRLVFKPNSASKK